MRDQKNNEIASPPIHQLSIGDAFAGLTSQEKLYAHHLARAAWYGTRIVLRQVSPESLGIFNLIMELYACCSGEWEDLARATQVDAVSLDAFLTYAATFLSNIGNYYGTGDQKFVPNIDPDIMDKIASISPKAQDLYQQVASSMLSTPPYSLGFPSDHAQSAYYPGPLRVAEEEISAVSQQLDSRSVLPENTRIHKFETSDQVVFEVLQASVQTDAQPLEFELPGSNTLIRLVRGDHSAELTKICSALTEASRHTSDPRQQAFLSKYVESFQTGSLESYRDSQRTWVCDLNPRVESIIGFVEPYRDPYGTRAEFEALVAIANPEETKVLTKLVENSTTFIRRLPWAAGFEENNRKGPFEKALFEPPGFASIHTLAYCSSILFGGINLPNYNDIRQECGFKNVIIANRLSAESKSTQTSPFVDASEVEQFEEHKFSASYLWLVLHELLGHGTGKLMAQDAQGKYNFDLDNPPIDPVSGRPITSWYRTGQTWTGQFRDLATTVDECRAELVGAYLMDDPDLLALFGFTDESSIAAEDITYNTYMQIGTRGLSALQNFNLEDNKWGQAHSRAHFAILKCLLSNSDGCLTIECDPKQDSLTVNVDRSKIRSHGKPALGRMLLKLHIFRSTADVDGCRAFYEPLSNVAGEYLEWRRIVVAKKQSKLIYVQANTFLDAAGVSLKEYEESTKGIIQSWAERAV